MDAATVKQWQQQADRQIELLEGLLAARGVARQDNAIFTFREVAARGRHRFDARLDVGPLWQDAAAEALRGFMLRAPWVPAVHSILGTNPETITSVVYSRPGADAQVSGTRDSVEHLDQCARTLCGPAAYCGMLRCLLLWSGLSGHA